MKFRILPGLTLWLMLSCQGPVKHETASDATHTDTTKKVSVKKDPICCEKNIPSRFAAASVILPPPGADTSNSSAPVDSSTRNGFPSAADRASHPGMLWIAGGAFRMGADNNQ